MIYGGVVPSHSSTKSFNLGLRKELDESGMSGLTGAYLTKQLWHSDSPLLMEILS